MNRYIRMVSIFSVFFLMSTLFSANSESSGMVQQSESTPTAKVVRQIQLEKRGMGKVYVLDNRELRGPVDFKWAYEKNKKSMDLYNGAQALMVLGYVFAIPGGAIAGYAVGTALGSGQPVNLPALGIGGGLGVLGVVFGLISDGSVKKSIDNFNADQKKVSGLNGLRLELGLTSATVWTRF